MGAWVMTVNDVLDGHVALDIQCLDRIISTPTSRAADQCVGRGVFVRASGWHCCIKRSAPPHLIPCARRGHPAARMPDLLRFSKVPEGACLPTLVHGEDASALMQQCPNHGGGEPQWNNGFLRPA
jgi:hypothetical protein